jgi:hypothetical protein
VLLVHPKCPLISRDDFFLSIRRFECDIIGDASMGIESTADINDQNSRYNKWADPALGSGSPHPTGINQAQAFFTNILRDHRDWGFGRTDFSNEQHRANFFEMAVGFMVYSVSTFPAAYSGIIQWPENSTYGRNFQVFL